MNNILKYSLLDAIGTTLYIALVASVMFYSKSDKIDAQPTLLIPIVMLMLFVFSAAVTGALILGKPLIWYLEGKKKEAILLLIYTLGIFLIILLILSLILKFTI